MQTTTNTTTHTTSDRGPQRASRGPRARRLGAGATAAMIVATTGASVIGVGAAGAQTAPPPGLHLPDVAGFVEEIVDDLSLGSMGTATGAELERLGAHLRPDRRYHYAQLAGGFEIRLPEAISEGTDFLPDSIEVPLGVEAVVVVDPSDPYVYIGGPCPAVPEDDRDTEDDDERSDADTAVTIADLLGDDPLPVLPVDLPEQDCGIGFSAEGNIPVRSTAGGDTYTGHVVIDGIVDVHPAVSLDGTFVARIDHTGVRATGHGDLIASLPFARDLVDISIPFGEAAVELEVTSERVGVGLEGAIRADENSTLPLGVPISLPAHGGIEAAMSLGMVNRAGTWVMDPASFLQVDAGLVIPLDVVARITQDRIGALERREPVLVADLGRIRSTVRAERQAHDRFLRDLRTGLEQAQADVSDIDGAIATNNRRIGTVTGRLHAEIRWFDSLPFLRRLAEGPGHGARVAGHHAELLALRADNELQRGLRPVAVDVLSWAGQQVERRRAALASANVDSDLRVQVVLGDLRNVRHELGQLRRSGAGDASASLRGDVTLRVDGSGVGGSLSASYCTTDGCRTLDGGRVHVGQNPRACVTVPVIGEEACVRL